MPSFLTWEVGGSQKCSCRLTVPWAALTDWGQWGREGVVPPCSGAGRGLCPSAVGQEGRLSPSAVGQGRGLFPPCSALVRSHLQCCPQLCPSPQLRRVGGSDHPSNPSPRWLVTSPCLSPCPHSPSQCSWGCSPTPNLAFP